MGKISNFAVCIVRNDVLNYYKLFCHNIFTNNNLITSFMKKFFILAAVLIFGFNLHSQNSAEWKWIHPKPQGQYLNWFKMLDSLNWLAAGSYGSFLKTTDAGATWKTSTGGYPSTSYPRSPIFMDFRSAWFFNANTGYLGVQSSYGIVKTTNGGHTFDTLPMNLGSKVFSNALYFLNQQTGFVAGSSPLKCARTTNGGLNWTVLPNQPTSTLNAVHAFDTGSVIVGGSTSGKLFRTSNSGANWDTVNFGTTNTIYCIKFINNNTGFISGSGGLFRCTTNGGLNWAGVNPPTTMTIYNIVMSGSVVYVSGSSSTDEIYKSSDLGNNWSVISYANAGQLSRLYPEGFDISGNTMVLAGSYGIMLKSTNSGSNWNAISYHRSLANMVDLYAQSGDGRIIALGSSIGTPDAVLFSNDGGITFNTGDLITWNNLASISMINPNTGYVSGRFGVLAKTTNGGTSWDTTIANNPVLSPYFANGIDFIDANTGWIVGGLPSVGGITKIFKTTNGGVNWFEQISAYAGPVGVKVDMYNANTGYMTGASIQKTTNGGDTWTQTALPVTGTTFTPIKTLDAQTVIIGAGNTQAYATTNGGANWDSLNFPVKAGNLFGMDAYDFNNIIVGTVIGLAGKTTNRGQSWQLYNIGGYTIYSMKMPHPDTIFAVCGNTAGAQVFKYIKGPVTSGFTYESSVPDGFSLKQNYPNPFNPVTNIEFDIVRAGNVSVKVFDIAGREYQTEIMNLFLMPGKYKMHFNGSALSSGIYFYSLTVDGSTVNTKKMILIK